MVNTIKILHNHGLHWVGIEARVTPEAETVPADLHGVTPTQSSWQDQSKVQHDENLLLERLGPWWHGCVERYWSRPLVAAGRSWSQSGCNDLRGYCVQDNILQGNIPISGEGLIGGKEK